MLLIITRFRILSVIVVAQQISVLWKQKNHVPVCVVSVSSGLVQAIVRAPVG